MSLLCSRRSEILTGTQAASGSRFCSAREDALCVPLLELEAWRAEELASPAIARSKTELLLGLEAWCSPPTSRTLCTVPFGFDGEVPIPCVPVTQRTATGQL